jgi:hypothetical protein
MPVKLPPPKEKTGKGERSQYLAFIKAHPVLKNYADAIWHYAQNVYGGFTATQVASVILFEHGYDGNGSPLNKPNAQGTGFGLAQINPKVWFGKKFPPTGEVIDAAWASKPGNAIHFATWLLHQSYAAGNTDIRSAYGTTYNPTFYEKNPGKAGPEGLLPKGYIGVGSQTPEGSATKAVATAHAKSTITDPWVVLTKGGFKFVNSDTPPPGTVQYGGQPITRTQYNQIWNQTYSDTFFAYTGRHAGAHEIQNILARAPSVYSLANELAGKPGFDKSPVWKQHAPGLVSYARTVLGENWKPSGGIIRKAIAQNWDQATFYAHIKQTDAYLKGPEFRDNKAKMQAVYEQVYGKADAGAHTLINETTLQGWTPDEFASWLRSQDAYKQTPEFQSKQVSFLSALGLITGQQATASVAPPNTGSPTPKPVGPNSKRIPGQGTLGTGTGLIVNGA